jgi:hypothetical protein
MAAFASLGQGDKENAAGPGGMVGLVDPHDPKLRDAAWMATIVEESSAVVHSTCAA